ncbi:MAG: NAD(P)/FAD-dependent oxidoreductase [Planctomycetes bacterium]|nr:NAD(P)/FAD-dependent oxidoreductase [Planctomycetota bacterium]
MLDVVIVGGGPAGLSAALVLGRCRRRVVVLDAGRPRNATSHALHGFLTRDGVPPLELLTIAREQLRPYAVELVDAQVAAARRHEGGGFEVELDDASRLFARRLLLATGVTDRLPEVEGFGPLYGKSAHHCPFCDGWEWRDQPLVAYARGPGAADFALLLTSWSRDVLLCTDDGEGPPPDDAARLARAGVALRVDRVARLDGHRGRLERVVFARGDAVARRALFFHLGTGSTGDLAAQLGCRCDDEVGVHTGPREETSEPGVWVAGDASKDVLLAIVAAAEGAKAAVDIHRSLLREDSPG